MVNAQGTAVERKLPPKKLTSGQRHYMYRLGLMALDQFMRNQGFTCNISEGSSTRLSYEKGKVLIDVAVKRPDNIAYVTSQPGYCYDPNKVTAKVTTLKDMLGADYVAQVIICDQDCSLRPIFVPLPKELENPARYVIENVLGVIAEACRTIPSVQKAFSERNVKEAQVQPIEEQQLDERVIPLLPE